MKEDAVSDPKAQRRDDLARKRSRYTETEAMRDRTYRVKREQRKVYTRSSFRSDSSGYGPGSAAAGVGPAPGLAHEGAVTTSHGRHLDEKEGQ
jgi:hypothetical protein